MGYQIEFVNHASVLIRSGEIGLLSDPWYRGPAFHKGWNLIVETPDEAVREVLGRTTHIWISHEHPDHFSPLFFKTHGDLIRERGIKILFQKIADQRVASFLRQNGFDLTELTFRRPYDLGGDVSVTCLKDEFYDSALSIRAGDAHILNLNDCAVSSEARAKEIFRDVGACDVLLTQFSYAAWKGGRENRDWRETAAAEKLRSMEVQAKVFQPKTVIPFASFVFFSNERNFYLNDAVNTPRRLVEHFAEAPFDLAVMKPGDVLPCDDLAAQTSAAVDWWEAKYAELSGRALLHYDRVEEAALEEAFEGYLQRIFANNARWFMTLMRRISPIRVLEPVAIRLDDLDKSYEVDICAGAFKPVSGPVDLQMSSESLAFLFRNTFGFDTLTVNGCLEEKRPGGFAKAAKSLAIENLNNLGIPFAPSIIVQPQVIMVFLERLANVRRKMRSAG